MKRRDFIKYSAATMAGLWVGSKVPPWARQAQAVVTPDLDFTITDAIKEMVTHNLINTAECYFWIYKEATLPAETPGPIIFAVEGDSINISVTNALDEKHELAIPGINFTTEPIDPGGTFSGIINVPRGSAGTYLYYDTLNAPVNRVMGLHGAFIVMPVVGNTPYNSPPLKVQRLFDDLGTQPWWPGLAWNKGSGVGGNGPFPDTPPFRQYVWLCSEASPRLFADVGNFTPGQDFPAATFLNRFLNNSFVPGGKNTPPAVPGDAPQYFTISGQSGHFAHNQPFTTPHLRVGEPCVLRMLNAGLWTHCLHIHANHFYVLKVRNELTGFNQFSAFEDLDPAVVPGVRDNHIWLDVYGAHPGDVWEYLLPYMRCPDVPNDLGIGRADLQQVLEVNPAPVPNYGFSLATGKLRKGPTPPGQKTWPPVQEINMMIPQAGTKIGGIPVHVQLSPLCFPMHDHSEPSQTAQGGNYNQGLIAGMNFIGDRNADGKLTGTFDPAGTGIEVGPDGKVLTFPHAPLMFEDPDLAPAFNERAVFGADPDTPVQPPAGPVPPFLEGM